jgi:HAD superfamily hydrolase (TIGR01484 family)
MMPNAVIFDLDGTLAESKSPMTREMGALLASLLSTTEVAVMSGGAWKQFETQLFPALPQNADLERLHIFPTSAARYYRFIDGSWKMVYDNSFSQLERQKVMHELHRALAETGLDAPPERVWGERIEDRGAEITFSGLGQEAPIEEKRKWDPDKSKRLPLEKRLIALLPGFSIRVNATTSVDITRAGIDKAYGVREFGKRNNIALSDMLYVGDALFSGGNDEVVKQTGVRTQQVAGPAQTAAVITELVAHAAHKESARALLSSWQGEMTDDPATLKKFSRDTSLFERMPSLVAYPKDAAEVASLVKAAHAARERGEPITLTGRSAGTDMSGGPLTRSVVVSFTKYLNKVRDVTRNSADDGSAVVEPGCYYRDFEKETLKKALLLPSYPASREIAAMGGIFNNDSGGERTLEYGKTRDYAEEVEAVLSDGSQVTFKALDARELAKKKEQRDFEGKIYREITALIENNRALIDSHRPKVSKNSAGYALWEVVDQKTGKVNLTKLLCGAQGTLALITAMKFRLIRPEEHRAMTVIFLKDLAVLPEVVRRVLTFTPESFESYDDHTLSLAVRFLPQMLSQMGLARAIRLGLSFLPEVGLVARGGLPKLILMAEFSAKTPAAALEKARKAEAAIADLTLPTRVAKNEQAAEKYWIVRRESFALLRKNLKGLYAAPFIDDFVVPPDSYPQFLPELNTLLDEYKDRMVYTIAGHIGNGNFHIIPLMDLSKPETKQTVLELAPKVYDLVLKYGGTTTGEHNDGIIRTPYLPQQFGTEMVHLFEETKKIFDPLNLFNPGKKVGGTFADIDKDMLKA